MAEPAELLLATAKSKGFTLSPAQVARWHRVGLLRRPRQQSLGRGRGTETIYPAGSTTQLLALCEQRMKKRSLKVVGWNLWLQGFPVAEKFWKADLRDAAQHWDRVRNKIERLLYPGGSTEPSERALKLFAKLAEARIANPIFRGVRKRVRTRRRN